GTCWLLQLVTRENDRAQQTAKVLLACIGASLNGVFPNSFIRVNVVVFLRKVADAQTVSGDNAAFAVGALNTGKKLQQCGLTGTVGAQHNDAGALVDGQVNASEYF